LRWYRDWLKELRHKDDDDIIQKKHILCLMEDEHRFVCILFISFILHKMYLFIDIDIYLYSVKFDSSTKFFKNTNVCALLYRCYFLTYFYYTLINFTVQLISIIKLLKKHSRCQSVLYILDLVKISGNQRILQFNTFYSRTKVDIKIVRAFPNN